MTIEIGPCFQKPGETLDWIFSTRRLPIFGISQFIGLSLPAIGVTVMWGFTGNDRDGNLLGGVKRWYTIENDGSAWQHFRFLVAKEGGDTSDFFNAQFNVF